MIRFKNYMIEGGYWPPLVEYNVMRFKEAAGGFMITVVGMAVVSEAHERTNH
jgi:hypothetical protein